MTSARRAGGEFRQLREEARLTQEQLAKYMRRSFGKGSVATINRIEKGERQPRPHELQLLHEAADKQRRLRSQGGGGEPGHPTDDTLGIARFWVQAAGPYFKPDPAQDPRYIAALALLDAYFRGVVEAEEAGRPWPAAPDWQRFIWQAISDHGRGEERADLPFDEWAQDEPDGRSQGRGGS